MSFDKKVTYILILYKGAFIYHGQNDYGERCEETGHLGKLLCRLNFYSFYTFNS